MSFVCIDMDRLKTVNDTYGHAAGDYAIRLIGQAIHEALPPDGIAARMGGDEYAVYIPDDGRQFSEAFSKKLKELNEKKVRPFCVTASVGIADILLDERTTLDYCLQRCDTEMYRAKGLRQQ